MTAATTLLGEGAGDLLPLALREGVQVRRWWVSQVRHVPGRHLVVRYGVEVGGPDGGARIHTVVAEQSDRRTPVAGRGAHVHRTADGDTVALWRYPFDPHLPGLAEAARVTHVRELLDRLDVGPGVVRVVPRTYRATRRAVLEVTRVPRDPADTGPCRLYIKVLPPRRTRRVADVHLAVAAVLPAPIPLAVDTSGGTLVLTEVRGRSLREVLTDPDGAVPDAAAVVALQQRLAGVDTGLSRAPSRPFGVSRGATALTALLPSRSALIAQVAAAAEAAVDPSDPVVTIHGDLHEAQILCAADGTLGLVDLDGTGPGPLLDDAATMLAHVLLVQRWHPSSAARTSAWADAYTDAVDRLVPADRVRRRAAGVLLGLAAGAVGTGRAGWRDQAEGRLALAARLAGG